MYVAVLPERSFLISSSSMIDFGDAAVGQAANEAGAADIGLVDLEPEARRQQHAERCNHAHQPAFLVGGLEHDHGQADIGAVLGGDALDQGALLGFGARRRITADLPVFVHRLDGALGKGAARGGERQQRGQRQRPRMDPSQRVPKRACLPCLEIPIVRSFGVRLSALSGRAD